MRQYSRIYITTITLTVISFFIHAQNYSDLKGKVYTNKQKLTDLTSCFEIEAKVDLERYLCRHYLDTLTKKHLILLEKESRFDTIKSYEILDIIVFDIISREQLVIIGSNEKVNSQKNETFVVAIECCQSTNQKWSSKSKNIIKAWTFDKSKNKFIELNSSKIYRINEGYYFK